MRKAIVKFLSFFILSSKKRKAFRKRYFDNFIKYCLFNGRYKIKGNNNKIIIVENGIERELCKYERIKGLDISINGNNNTIILHKPLLGIHDSIFEIIGNSNLIEIGSSPYRIELKVMLKWDCCNRKIIIGDNFSCDLTKIYINEDNGICKIGNDCMFSNNITVRTDGHAILNDKNEVINNFANIEIGNHVWCGEKCTILKSALIPNNSIIGVGSIVTKKYKQENIILAGNPAKIIKENINWSRYNASYIVKGRI